MKREDFDAKLAEAICAKNVRCGLSYDADSCERSLMVGFISQYGLNGQHGAALDAGQLHYDADAAEACLEKIRDGSCDQSPLSTRMSLQGVGMSSDCRFLSGQVADGGQCHWSGECGAGSLCSTTAPWYCGTCQPPRGEGASSGSYLLCGDGLVSIQSTCQQPLKEGQTCDEHMNVGWEDPCGEGLFCDLDTHVCTSPPSKGEACDRQSHPCAWNLACIDATCHARGGKGEACTIAPSSSASDYSICQQELFCDADAGASGRCRPLLGEGASCRDYRECGRGLYCEGADSGSGQRGTCRRYAREGEGCADRLCEPRFYCSRSSTTCELRRQMDESCADEPSSCAMGISCNGRDCVGLDYTCHP